MHPEVARLVAELALREHPEGGWYRETWRSATTIPAAVLATKRTGPRAAGSAILYLLAGEQVSRLHRLPDDEVWHHHAGCGLDLHLFWPATAEGPLRYERRGLGLDPERRQSPQVVVSGGCWFGATVADPDGFALVGCTMAPGFDFADLAFATAATLSPTTTEHTALLARLVGPNDRPAHPEE
jgi:predicted cupin superfamily sugar epimerase